MKMSCAFALLLFLVTCRTYGAFVFPTTTTRPLSSSTRLAAAAPLLLEDLGSMYNFYMQHYHLATHSLMAGLFAATGDALAQQTTTSSSSSSCKSRWDAQRSAQFFAKGLGSGLSWSTWYDAADNVSDDVLGFIFGQVDTESAASLSSLLAQRVAMSIVLEQFIVAPVFYTTWDIPVPALLAGTPMRSLGRTVRGKIGPMLRANAVVWTPANVVTYTLPAEYRFVFASAADLVWQTVSSRILNANNSGDTMVSTIVTPTPTDPSLSNNGVLVDKSLSRAAQRRFVRESA